ncbi:MULTISPECIES: ParB N-terminal domain-containing protein [Streptacidiphilus]|uniref:ParB N-terminal domain-containing protein n=1 Tax=Streptacidiphilus cavernicola TaxID=3342716 RepID=A0ABV6UEC9_9ACTN|nr:ParB N-terminal domain-containing protein [Streptacidiphilus jeojiense]
MRASERLSGSDSFEAAARPRSSRRRMIDEAVTDPAAAGPGTAAAAAAAASAFAGAVPLDRLAPNPRNPREDLGDLEDLRSIAELQLQACLAVTREAYLRIWPEDEPLLGAGVDHVVVNGCRRYAAAVRFGRDTLEICVKDEVAASREALLAASIQENIDRRDFDVLEEARAVEAMVAACEGSGVAAARRLNRSPGWISQRRALLELAPELQSRLRAGDLAVRDARRLARVPLAEQVAAWREEAARAELQRAERQAARAAVAAVRASHPPLPLPSPAAAPDSRPASSAAEPAEPVSLPQRRRDHDPASVPVPPFGSPPDLARALLAAYSRDQIHELVRLLLAAGRG